MAQTVMQDILALAVQSNASDVHFKFNHPVAFRIDGRIVRTDFVANDEYFDQALNGMLNEAQFERLERTGDVDISHVEDGVGRFRINVHRQKGVPAITMRYVKSKIFDFETLGLPPILQTIAESERGIVFITGTTGSGKSTTLAAMLQHINLNFNYHIITVEDPIEYEFHDEKSLIEQREVGLDTETFDSALMHSLRQDPDIIAIGEMRSAESFDAALQAADTGHIVFTTLHTINASQSINRILDFYDSTQQEAIRMALATNLRAIISQRLIPKAIGGGVVPAVEILINTPIIQKLLIQDKLDKLSHAIENSTKDGMQSFNQSLYQLVNEGKITEEDALLNANNPEALKMNLQGIFLNTADQIIGD